MPDGAQTPPPEPEAGTQNLVPKRLNLASKMVAANVQLWDAVTTLEELALEAAQAGNFADTDFLGSSLEHLTGFMTGLMLTTVGPGIVTLLTTALPNGGPIPRDVILQTLP